jgi:MoxR-like ATPase
MTTPATDRQLDLLQSLTARDWRPTGISKADAQVLLDKLLTVKREVSGAAAQRAGQKLHDEAVRKGQGQGEGQGEGQGDEGRGEEGQGEGEAPQQPAGNGVMPSIEDLVVGAVKARRTEVLEGLDLKTVTERVVRIVKPDLSHVVIAGQHETFAELVEVLAQRDHVMLVGPAGTGKTTGAKKAAEALGLGWSYWACNPRVTASALMGFMDANGQYVRTQFRDAYEHGLLFVLDEMDNAAEDLVVALNGAIENGVASFPDGLVERHENFVVVATANTYGKGGSRVYTRRQLDGASLDRFVVLDWGYDQDLERQLAPVDDWTDFVQAVRAVVEEQTIREVVSMRASIRGGKYLKLGWSWARVEETQLFRGWGTDALSKVEPVRRKFKAQAALYQGGAS